MWLQSILVCIFVSVATSWILPPGDFLRQVATEHDRTSIIIYLPHMIPLKWIKNNFVGRSNKSASIIPVSFVIPSLVTNFSWILNTNEDLHIFVPDDIDKKSMEGSVEQFIEIYGMRSNSRREHWLLSLIHI